jgi:hypothetical protein
MPRAVTADLKLESACCQSTKSMQIGISESSKDALSWLKLPRLMGRGMTMARSRSEYLRAAADAGAKSKHLGVGQQLGQNGLDGLVLAGL